MFTPSPLSLQGLRGFQAGKAYHLVGIETSAATASPHKLVQMLFDGLLQSIAVAKGAIASGDVERKCSALSRAARIVDEGLRAGLNLDAGGSLAADLADLYTYLSMRLTQANLRNEVDKIDECIRLVTPLRDAWVAIGPEVDAGAR